MIVDAWQFLSQPKREWPSWVHGEPVNFGVELRHERWSGRQIVYHGEYLMLDIDGIVHGSATGGPSNMRR